MKAYFKKLVFILLLTVSGIYIHAQTPPDFDLIKLEKAPDYRAAEPFALQTSVYILSTPFKEENKDRLKSLQFLVKWMSGTPDYSFVLEEIATKVFKNDKDLLGVYLAAMTRYALEHKDSAKDAKVLRLNAIIIVLNYCENKDNNMKMTKQLKKLADAKAEGKLEESLQKI